MNRRLDPMKDNSTGSLTARVFLKEIKNDRLTKQEIVFDQVLTLIMQGEYRPGERLNQDVLAKKLNVSITPLREVLNRLATYGTVENQPGRGFLIPHVDQEAIMDLLNIWRVFRIMSIRWVFERCTRLQLNTLAVELQNIQERIETASSGRDVVKCRKLMLVSNYTIVITSGSPALWSCMEGLWLQFSSAVKYNADHVNTFSKYQLEIIHAIENDNLDKAIDAINASMNKTISAAM